MKPLKDGKKRLSNENLEPGDVIVRYGVFAGLVWHDEVVSVEFHDDDTCTIHSKPFPPESHVRTVVNEYPHVLSPEQVEDMRERAKAVTISGNLHNRLKTPGTA